jgi:adenylate cyclase
MALNFNNVFSDAISNLQLEDAKSEFQRSYLLIVLFFLILVVVCINFFLLSETVVKFYGGTQTFLTLSGFIVVFLTYQALILFYLKKKLGSTRGTSMLFKFIHTTIELSFPTAIIFYMMTAQKMLSFIDSPVALTYFLFIILSVLHLDFKVNIFSGLLAAAEYAFLTYYGFHFVDHDPQYSSSTPENSHYIRTVVLVFSGAAAAFVSRELKNRITSTLDYQAKKNELELLFGQQVSREVSRALIEDKGITKRSEATVMFLDIRNFTGFADTHTAEEVIDYQNRFLGPVIDIINQHQGVVFQILGDGLMACFGSPGENVLHADMAFQASIAILKQVKNATDKSDIPPTTIGIGLHSGPLVTGNIGNDMRKQFSISGTPVIVASRIEQLNKKYGSQLLISGEVYHKIARGKMEMTFLGEEPLKGIGTPVEIYKVL